MSLLHVNQLTMRLASEAGWVHALDDMALTIERGQTFALVGESGCGKSMTALSIARLLPDAGAIIAGQVNLSDRKASLQQDLLQLTERQMRAVRGKRVSMIFQEPGTSLNPVMTVGEQLLEVLQTHLKLDKVAALAKAAEWLDRVGIPEPKARLNHYPNQLSGGQKQRVMIAMALATQPDLLIADEPTTALDVAIQAQVLDLLKTLQAEEGMAMLLITHDLGIVKQMAHTVGLMYAGQLVEVASIDAFFANPRHPYARALMRALPSAANRGHALMALEGRVPSLVNLPQGCRFAPRCEHRKEVCTEAGPALRPANEQHLVRCVRAHETLVQHSPSVAVQGTSVEQSQSEPVMALKALSVAYAQQGSWLKTRHITTLHGLDVALIPGRTVALVGESGSGKTTAARAILGLLPGSAKVQGEVTLKGKPLQAWGERGPDGWRRQVQFVFQDPFASLNPRHRVQEILEEPLVHLRPDLDASSRQQRVLQMLEEVGLPPTATDRFPHEFSGGQRQRIALARALVSEPSVLVCDEPTSALDVSVQAQILNLLRTLQGRTGVAMLFITHNLAVVRYLADEVVVLRHGRVVERGPARQVFESPLDLYTRELIAAAPHL